SWNLRVELPPFRMRTFTYEACRTGAFSFSVLFSAGKYAEIFGTSLNELRTGRSKLRCCAVAPAQQNQRLWGDRRHAFSLAKTGELTIRQISPDEAIRSRLFVVQERGLGMKITPSGRSTFSTQKELMYVEVSKYLTHSPYQKISLER